MLCLAGLKGLNKAVLRSPCFSIGRTSKQGLIIFWKLGGEEDRVSWVPRHWYPTTTNPSKIMMRQCARVWFLIGQALGPQAIYLQGRVDMEELNVIEGSK
jgi:hypothetical protein